ncbi:MAG: hypothetical protein H0U52_01475 [Chloroflexi bacterium]|nr:hypothetical protein [Chloroflexota bacterium]
MHLDVEVLRSTTADLLAKVCVHHPQGEALFQAVEEGRAEVLISHAMSTGAIIVAVADPRGTLDDAQAVATISARTGEVTFARFGGEPEPVH